MLPGFRFLLAAIMLSMSVLVFGLGAAALLRAAHEEFASTPAWRVAPEPKFARQNEPVREEPMPVLAILRVEPEPAQPTATDSIPAAAAPAEPAAIAPMPDQPGKIAALEPQDKTPPEAAKPDIAVPEMSGQSEAPAVDTPAPVPAEETRIATVEQVLPPASEAGAPAPQQSIAPPAAGTDIVATRIATLGGPSVAIEAQPPARPPAPSPIPMQPGNGCRRGAPRSAAGSRCGRDRPRLSNRPPIRSRSRRSPRVAAKVFRPDRSRPAGRRAGPIRPTSRHTALSRARRAGTAPASAPARRRRSRSWSRSAL